MIDKNSLMYKLLATAFQKGYSHGCVDTRRAMQLNVEPHGPMPTEEDIKEIFRLAGWKK